MHQADVLSCRQKGKMMTFLIVLLDFEHAFDTVGWSV